MRRTTDLCCLVLVFFFLSTTALHAQANHPPSIAAVPSSTPFQPAATFQVSTRLVTVEVVARDHHGNSIPGLTADDFQIFEQVGGKKSSILKKSPRSAPSASPNWRLQTPAKGQCHRRLQQLGHNAENAGASDSLASGWIEHRPDVANAGSPADDQNARPPFPTMCRWRSFCLAIGCKWSRTSPPIPSW